MKQKVFKIRGRVTFVCCMLCLMAGHAQNLVNNPGFEQYATCPDYVSQIHYCTGWERPTDGTSDYFNSCLGVPFSVSVPDNQFGIQQPSGGNGYAGLYVFYSPVAFNTVPEGNREYITSRLIQPLQTGKTYYAEFKISLSEASRYAVSDLGMLFSITKPVRQDDLAIQSTPQVGHVSALPLSNKTGWTKISGCFIADSAYEYITIGNFKTGANTVFTHVGTQTSGLHYSYYYIDDILVTAPDKPLIKTGPDTCGPVSLSIINYNNNAQYLWSEGSTTSTVMITASGFYWCTVFTGECQIVSDSVEVFVSQPINFSLGQDTSINFCMTNQWILTPLIDSVSGYTYLWSTGETTFQHTIVSGGTYILTVTDDKGCEAVRSIRVTDACDGILYAPTAFTPNHDGRNDEFYCFGKNIRLVYFSVFNRWGKEVYHSGDLSVRWDGKNAPDGLYVWKAVYDKQENNHQIQTIGYGSVLLLR